MIREREHAAMSGWLALALLVGATAFAVWQMIESSQAGRGGWVVAFERSTQPVINAGTLHH